MKLKIYLKNLLRLARSKIQNFILYFGRTKPQCRSNTARLCRAIARVKRAPIILRRLAAGRTSFNVRSLKFQKNGQSLVEILIGLGVGAIVVIGVASLLVSNLKSSLNIKLNQDAAALAQEELDLVKSVSESDWHKIYGLDKWPNATTTYFYSSSTQAIATGTESLISDNRNFIRYFYIQNVNRDQCGLGNINSNPQSGCPGSGIAEDPSTQNITVTVQFNGNTIIAESEYISRRRNNTFVQADWSGGLTATDTVVTQPDNKFASSTSIDYSASNAIRLQGF